MEFAQDTVTVVGDLKVWITGHLLGSVVALLARRNLAKTGAFLKSFLINPPFFSVPIEILFYPPFFSAAIERIKDKKLKHGIHIASSLITEGCSMAVKGYNENSPSEDPLLSLSTWVPYLFLNPADDICSEYVQYFEHRKKMKEIGAGSIEKVTTQNSIGGLFIHVIGQEAELLQLLPSVNLTINQSPSSDFKHALGIHKCWRTKLQIIQN
uniref:Uncharacterized protein n=1 Tax=Nelumbo nucifera TaxID=4432 RepID=A0A822ZU28_NELNU|nr:TPA_asm: hypothetical protein HUJ06_018669 [Nelumbo nucifera]